MYVYSNKFLIKDEYQRLRENIRILYKQFRSPLLLIHNFSMIAATILGIIHGIVMGIEEEAAIFGWIAAISMIILSFSGFVIWFKLKPIWSNRESRKFIRFLHRQWLFSGIFCVFLFIHLIA